MKKNQLIPILLTLSFVIFFSCENLEEVIPAVAKDNVDNTVEYVINKNGHSSMSSIQKVEINSLKFKARFDSSAKYITDDPVNQADINKLYGFSDCNSHHHTNSARFGWRWYNGQLEIHAYTYLNGIRNHQYITSVNVNKTYTYELKAEKEQYLFILNGTAVALPRGCSGPASGYKLFPYFGGNETAPDTITIVITEIE